SHEERPMPRRYLLPTFALAVASAAVLALGARTQQPAPGTKPPTGNVRDHGAKGDGNADDWQAIQNAVDAGVGVVHLPPGTYRVTKPVVVDLAKVRFTAIRGDGARVVMAGEGPAFRFVGSHAGTADPKTVKDAVWANERMPSLEGVEIVGGHENADA